MWPAGSTETNGQKTVEYLIMQSSTACPTQSVFSPSLCSLFLQPAAQPLPCPLSTASSSLGPLSQPPHLSSATPYISDCLSSCPITPSFYSSSVSLYSCSVPQSTSTTTIQFRRCIVKKKI